MQNTGLNFTEHVDLEVLEKMQSDEPLAVYIKTIIGKLGVIIVNPTTMRQEERILKGDPRSKKSDIEDLVVKLWTKGTHTYFKNANKRLLEEGKLVPYDYKSGKQEVNLSNAIKDSEIEEILSQPFFTLKNRLEEVTSSVTVERFLRIAEELNRPIGTVNHIREKLHELQKAEGLDNRRLEEHYQNLEV